MFQVMQGRKIVKVARTFQEAATWAYERCMPSKEWGNIAREQRLGLKFDIVEV